MNDKIIKFPKEFTPKPSYDPVPVNQVLRSADKYDLHQVIVLGVAKDGEIKIFTSESDTKEIVYLCEYAKALVTKSVIGDLILDIK